MCIRLRTFVVLFRVYTPSPKHKCYISLEHLPGSFRLSTFDLYFIIDGKAAASTISSHTQQPPPGHDPVRVSYPWAPMC